MEVRVLSPALLIALALAGAACSGDAQEPRAASSPLVPTWPGPPAASSSGRVAVGSFNRFLERRPDVARSPLRAGIEFVRLDRVDAATTSAVASGGREGRERAEVVLTASGLLDDSVRAIRYVLRFERRDDKTWRLRAARQAQRCWPGRGHRALSPRPCV